MKQAQLKTRLLGSYGYEYDCTSNWTRLAFPMLSSRARNRYLAIRHTFKAKFTGFELDNCFCYEHNLAEHNFT